MYKKSLFAFVALVAISMAAATPGTATMAPEEQPVVENQFGTASWYGEQFHGRRAASGEIYNMYALTGAHKSLPLNTLVRVTNLINDHEVVVRINDRGPYHPGRDLDLSYAAADRIGMLRTGVVPVRFQILHPDSYPQPEA